MAGLQIPSSLNVLHFVPNAAFAAIGGTSVSSLRLVFEPSVRLPVKPLQVKPRGSSTLSFSACVKDYEVVYVPEIVGAEQAHHLLCRLVASFHPGAQSPAAAPPQVSFYLVLDDALGTPLTVPPGTNFQHTIIAHVNGGEVAPEHLPLEAGRDGCTFTRSFDLQALVTCMKYGKKLLRLGAEIEVAGRGPEHWVTSCPLYICSRRSAAQRHTTPLSGVPVRAFPPVPTPLAPPARSELPLGASPAAAAAVAPPAAAPLSRAKTLAEYGVHVPPSGAGPATSPSSSDSPAPCSPLSPLSGGDGGPPQKRARTEGPAPLPAELAVEAAGLAEAPVAGLALDDSLWTDSLLIPDPFEGVGFLELTQSTAAGEAPAAVAVAAAGGSGSGSGAPGPSIPKRFASNLYNILTINNPRSDEVDRIIDEVVTRQWSMAHVLPDVRRPEWWAGVGDELRRLGSAAGNVRIEAYGDMLALVHDFLASFEEEWDRLTTDLGGEGAESDADGEAARMEALVPFARVLALAERELDLAPAGMALDPDGVAFLRDRAGCGGADAVGNGHFYGLWRWLFFAGRFRRAAAELWTDRAAIATATGSVEVSFLSHALKSRDYVERLLREQAAGVFLLRLSSKAFPSPNAACVVISSVLTPAPRPGAAPKFEHMLLNVRDCASRESVLKVVNENRGRLIWMWPARPDPNADGKGSYLFVEKPDSAPPPA